MQEKILNALTETRYNFADLDREIEMLALGALAGQHSYLVGPAGVAKSALARAIASIFGGSFFGIQCTAQTVVEDLFGPLDVPAYRGKLTWSEHFQANLALDASSLSEEVKRERRAALDAALAEGSRKVHHTKGYLPEAEMVFLDEPDKASSVTYQALLLALNERKFNQGGEMKDLPLRSAILAGNAMPDPVVAHAFIDRIAVRMRVDRKLADSDFTDVIFNRISALPPKTKITADEWQTAREQIARVETGGMEFVAVTLRKNLLAAGFEVTPRRWKATVEIAKAKAWLSGRDSLRENDMIVARHTLWNTVDSIPKIQEIVERICAGPVEEVRERVDTLIEEFRSHTKFGTEWDRTMTEIKAEISEIQSMVKRAPDHAPELEAQAERLRTLYSEARKDLLSRFEEPK